MLELVIFDADGVLFDSKESNIAYYNAIFAAMGEPPLDPDEEAASVSMASAQLFAARAKGDRARVARMHELGATLDCRPIFSLLKPSPGLKPFLLKLREQYKIALATNRSDTVTALIEYLDLDHVFDTVACARDHGVRPKPAPDILRLCIERVGTSPQASVYVGDSEIDRIAAQGAGVYFVGLGGRAGAPRSISTLADLPSLLRKDFA